MKLVCCKKNAFGLTLVELMISMVLSLIVMGGAIGIFVSSKQAYRTEDAMSRNQEAGRFAIADLTRQVRSAGYIGCSSLEVTKPNIVAESCPSFDNGSSIIGYDGGLNNASSKDSNWAKPTSITWVPNTDVIVVSTAGGCGADLSTDMGAMDVNIQVSNAASCGFGAGDLLLITDCETADLFRATAVTLSGSGDIATISHETDDATGKAVNTSGSLSRAYDKGSTVLRFLQTTYFIGKPVYDNSNTYRPNPALYRIGVNGKIEEVVDNVENMQIEYGIDIGNDGIVDEYKGAGRVTDWGHVLSVRLSLLIRSDDGVISAPQSVSFNSENINSGENADRRLRSIFNTIISLRNRLP